MSRRIKITDKKLRKDGGKKVYGIAYSNGKIHIDPRQDSEEYLDTIIHEIMHVRFPWMTEEEVIASSNIISHEIWKKNYRRIKD